jgi:hypothetical protein
MHGYVFCICAVATVFLLREMQDEEGEVDEAFAGPVEFREGIWQSRAWNER